LNRFFLRMLRLEFLYAINLRFGWLLHLHYILDLKEKFFIVSQIMCRDVYFYANLTKVDW